MTPIAWPRLSSQVDVLEDRHRRLAVGARAGRSRRLRPCTRSSTSAPAPAVPAVRAAGPRRGEQALRVVVLRRGEQSLGGADLAHAAVAQHQDVVGHLRHHRQVVADVHRRHLALAHHAAEGAQHLDLRRHVERGGGLVEDHDLGVGDQRHRRHQPLQLAARDLVRVALADGLRIRQRQLAEQRDRLQLGLGRAAACRARRPARPPGRGSCAKGRTTPPRSARCRTRCGRAARAAAARRARARPRRRCARCRR